MMISFLNLRIEKSYNKIGRAPPHDTYVYYIFWYHVRFEILVEKFNLFAWLFVLPVCTSPIEESKDFPPYNQFVSKAIRSAPDQINLRNLHRVNGPIHGLTAQSNATLPATLVSSIFLPFTAIDRPRVKCQMRSLTKSRKSSSKSVARELRKWLIEPLFFYFFSADK